MSSSELDAAQPMKAGPDLATVPASLPSRLAQTTLDASLRPSSMPERVHELLRSQILSGQIASGEKINQGELAAVIGTSRVPVREALRRLESEGLVVLRPHRGYVVASLDAKEIEEIFEIRTMLEERAGQMAARHRTDEDLAALAAILDRMDLVAERSDDVITDWAAGNREFHDRLFAASGRMHLCRVIGMLRDSVERYIRLFAAMRGNRHQAQAEHRMILAVLRDGDAAELGRICGEHCRHTCDGLLSVLRKEPDRRRDSQDGP